MFNTSNISNQKFYLNGSFISGVQSLSISYDTNIKPSFAINDTGNNYIISEPIVINFNLSYIPSLQEPFINYTGANFFSGRLEYANKYIDFSSGYIEDYTISSQINRPVEVSVAGKIFGILAYQTGFNILNSGSINYNIDPINYSYLDVNLPEANINRLNSCTITFSCPKIANYTIGEYLPAYIVSQYPINISSSFDFEISEEIIQNPISFFSNLNLQNIVINFKNTSNLNIIQSFNLKNMAYSNENYNFSINDNGRFRVDFNGYINS